MDLSKSASPAHTHTLGELSSSASEAACASPIHEQDVSDSSSESEASQTSDASQSTAHTASKEPTPDDDDDDDHEEEHDSHFTGDLTKNQRREVKSQFLGSIDMYVSQS